MFSWQSSANLKVVGIEGHSPDSLRSEINRGAKFVIYSYNFSLLVMSFKRPSNIYFIRPGQNRVVKGLPFTLVSLVFGWWGIPWGVVYTFQSLYQNLGGGTDVTDSMLASFGPPPLSGDGTPPLPPRPVAPPVSPLRIAYVIGFVAAVVGLVYSGICFYHGRNVPVALISGLKTPYAIELNGVSHQLSPDHTEFFTLAEGDLVMRGAPGTAGEQHLSVHTDFFSRAFDHRVLVINPDRAGVVYRQTTYYHPTGTTPDPNESNAVDLYANDTSYFLANPDHFFEDFPKSISMPSGTSVLAKSRIAAFSDLSVDELAPLLSQKLGYEAVRIYLTNLARFQPEEDDLWQQIYAQLKPEDARTLFEAHLADRPLLIEWHRMYQGFMESHFAAVDILARYRKGMEAEPDDGASFYLYARLLTDPAISHPLYEKALHAKHPSPYAAYALATDAFAAGHYPECLDLLTRAERDGLHSSSLQERKRDTFLALGNVDALLAEIRQRRVQENTDVKLFTDELMLAQSRHPDPAGARSAIAAFIAALRHRYGAGNYQPTETYLAAHLAYGLGKERAAATSSGTLKGPMNLFETAICLRDHAAATKALATIKQVPARYFWILMLTAHDQGDAAAAEKYFQQAVASLRQSDRQARDVAQHIAGATEADHAEILRTSNYADDLRVLFTALGVHFPAQRDAYFARARELDHDPAFPHLLLQSVRHDAGSSASL